MFGESDSESPRVPSPWDTFISTPPSPSPRGPSPLALSSMPKLVPEQDDGNVEYKLQLLSPSPARFARLVTQMKWRLLEGGGQAYYELGVADSGMLVGLPRAELEQSLETLEMMAGEIGASVIVVKEIEVPAAMVGLVAATAAQPDSWNGKRTRRRQGLPASASDADDSTATNTETDLSSTDVEDDDALSSKDDAAGIFTMDDVDDADASPAHFDLEIASVYKPRPVRTKAPTQAPFSSAKKNRGPKAKKGAHLPDVLAPPFPNEHEYFTGSGRHSKTQNRRAARDRKREERRQALLHCAAAAVAVTEDANKACADADTDADADALAASLETLHVSVGAPASAIAVPALDDTDLTAPDPELTVREEEDDDDDVFPAPVTALPGPFIGFASHLTVPVETTNTNAQTKEEEGSTYMPRLIVEALVVRKMSLEEAFLDFSGFSLT